MSPESEATILVVDDNEMNRDILGRRLLQRGYRVELAENGQAALNKILQHKIDLVLLDIEMPIIDGIAVLKILRKTYTMVDLPVIMVTARGEAGDVVQALELGANDYIMKPLDLAVVPARVKTQLALKQKSDEAKLLTQKLESSNALIRSIFGRYVATEVVDKLLETPHTLDFGGELRTVSVLVADLRGFSLLADGPFTAAEIVQMLNNFLGTMTEIVSRHHGIVDEIVGDGILAFFGAPSSQPDHAQRAVACALEMQSSIAAVNAFNRERGLPELSMGIGIHTGEAIVGNIGSTTRCKYSVVGKHVNLAARIESSSCGNQILVSEATLAHSGAILRIDGQIVIRPKGHAEPVTAFEIGGIGGDYNLFLPHYKDELVDLSELVPAQCAIVDNKSLGAETFQVHLTRLSAKSAELTSERGLWPLTDLAIFLGAENGTKDVVPCVYGKVTAHSEANAKQVCVRFTSILPQTLSAIENLLHKFQVSGAHPAAPAEP